MEQIYKKESLNYKKDTLVQEEILRSVNEIKQLKTTILSLRDELESMKFEKDAEKQGEVQHLTKEIKQLKTTISILRRDIETPQKI